jgi:hypothetical protein
MLQARTDFRVLLQSLPGEVIPKRKAVAVSYSSAGVLADASEMTRLTTRHL